jgi:ATP/maltotriose-dependent transcriptional regulator MalT
MRLAATLGSTDFTYFGYDHRIRTLSVQARALWFAGFPDQAAEIGRQAIEEANRGEQPINLSVATLLMGTVLIWRGDLDRAEELLATFRQFARKHPVGPSTSGAVALVGELDVIRGDAQAGVELLRQALASMREQHQYVLITRCHQALAEGLLKCGDAPQADAVIDAAIARAEAQGGSCDLPDLLRTKAEIGLTGRLADAAAAEALLRHAIELSQRQSSPSLELRAACALAQLWADEGRMDEALRLVSDVYDQFTEGFDTADLRRARGLMTAWQAGPARGPREAGGVRDAGSLPIP